MNTEEINMLLVIGVSLITGIILGSLSLLLLIKDNTNELEKEVETLHRKLQDCLNAYDTVVS